MRFTRRLRLLHLRKSTDVFGAEIGQSQVPADKIERFKSEHWMSSKKKRFTAFCVRLSFLTIRAGRREVASPGTQAQVEPRKKLPRLSPVSIRNLLSRR
jgi:hypothetical protein